MDNDEPNCKNCGQLHAECLCMAAFSTEELRNDLAASAMDMQMCLKLNRSRFEDRIEGNRRIIESIQ